MEILIIFLSISNATKINTQVNQPEAETKKDKIQSQVEMNLMIHQICLFTYEDSKPSSNFHSQK